MVVFVLGAVTGGIIDQWGVPRLIDLIEDDPIARTELRLYQPSQEGVRVAQRVRGDCLADLSIADFGNPNAHRCFASDREGSTIHDPCFSVVPFIRRGMTLVCVSAPWVEEATVLTVASVRRIERPSDQGATEEQRDARRRRAPVWALELENGDGCIFATGVTREIAGRRANYVCFSTDVRPSPETLTGSIAGEPDRSERVWRVHFSRTGASEFREIIVRTAWL